MKFDIEVKILLLCILILGVSVLLLGVRVFFVKGGKFPDTHIHSNEGMKKHNITCVSSNEEK
ncbi:MAG: hypothetical protein IJ328_05470 [Muribaculaceae bacterium]|nr:hypothetical protein [Muribaculaceae bacterium]